ncbi:MAG: 3-deoxy-D-manno-octulosonic acid transferase [Parachlamydiales bacterium]|nr:3-deoxy-D-manno-octulosonic acid transferase [Parachlamydiales bacterium]
MGFSFFYNMILLGYLFFLLPKILFDGLFRRKSFQHHLRRFFYSLEVPKGRYVIWIHAVSLGETKSAVSLIRELKEQYPSVFIIFSTITTTGMEEALKSVAADARIYLPFDFSFLMRRILRKTHPNLVIFIESDFWLHFAKYAKKEGAKIVALSAKISQRSARRYKKCLFFSKKLFSLFDRIYVQNSLYEERFLTLDIPSDKLKIAPNLKLSANISALSLEEQKKWKDHFCITDHFVVTIASTHYPEEKLLLHALRPLLSSSTKIFLAPRHPERFTEVKNLLVKEKLPFSLFSNPVELEKASVILVDTMGFLPVCYSLSDLAIVAGSFIPNVGGHNILEPIFCNIPVIFGPYMDAQKEFQRLVETEMAGQGVGLDRLYSYLEEFKNNSLVRSQLQQGVKNLQRKLKNSLKDIIEELIENTDNGKILKTTKK